MKHIYVSNLQFSATKDEIQALFRNYGHVYRITLLRDAAPGRRRLFALVEMPNDAESARAIAALNGFELRGLHLSVSGGLSLGAPLRAEES
ncbi:MAG: RNA recognition motif domain-containing protein, partial [Terriglobales bacterium]